MILGIMQPYFFPGLGYFDLIRCTDRWVVFDAVQFRRHSWINRNRILHPSSGWQYVVAPLQKHSRDATIAEVRVVEGDGWKDRIVAQLGHYRKKAPFYDDTVAIVRACLAPDEPSLARLNVHILTTLCDVLQVSFQPEWFSDLDLDLGDERPGPGEWALRIAEALRASVYVNPPGGRDLFDPEAFAAAGVRLVIRSFDDLRYEPRGYTAEPGLSVIDVLMWNDLATVREHLAARAP